MKNSAPIGIFDSGIGGLTVVREMAARIPEERLIYLGDTARVPYGVRSPETVRRYALEGARFLLGKGIKLLVVACNTVSAVGLDELASITDVPVIGVILPGARAAARATSSKSVGVIGTYATIGSGAYERAISAEAPKVRTGSLPCPLFVPLVEEGWLKGEVPELVAATYLGSLRRDNALEDMDTLVLGCTHYPLLKPMLAGVLGPGVRLIDSAKETASEVAEALDLKDVGRSGGPGSMEFFVTDSPEKFAEVGGGFLGSPIKDINKIELEAEG